MLKIKLSQSIEAGRIIIVWGKTYLSGTIAELKMANPFLTNRLAIDFYSKSQSKKSWYHTNLERILSDF